MSKIIKYLRSKISSIIIFMLSTTAVVALEYLIDKERESSVFQQYCYISVIVIIFYLIFLILSEIGRFLYYNLRNVRKQSHSTQIFVSKIPTEEINQIFISSESFNDYISKKELSAIDICHANYFLGIFVRQSLYCHRVLADEIIPSRAQNTETENICKESFCAINEEYDIANVAHTILVLSNQYLKESRNIKMWIRFKMYDECNIPSANAVIASLNSNIEKIELIVERYCSLIARINELQHSAD